MAFNRDNSTNASFSSNGGDLRKSLEQIKTEVGNFGLVRKRWLFKYCIEELGMKDYIYEKLSSKQRVYYEVQNH